VKIIALSGRAETQQIALTAGVDGFISKGDPPERVLTTLRAIIIAAPQDGDPA
jgi:CheY-like chemotaxis protein